MVLSGAQNLGEIWTYFFCSIDNLYGRGSYVARNIVDPILSSNSLYFLWMVCFLKPTHGLTDWWWQEGRIGWLMAVWLSDTLWDCQNKLTTELNANFYFAWSVWIIGSFYRQNVLSTMLQALNYSSISDHLKKTLKKFGRLFSHQEVSHKITGICNILWHYVEKIKLCIFQAET